MPSIDNRRAQQQQLKLPLDYDPCYFGRGWFVINSLGVVGQQRVATPCGRMVYTDLEEGEYLKSAVLGEPHTRCWDLLPQPVRAALRRRFIAIYDRERHQWAAAAVRLPVERIWVAD